MPWKARQSAGQEGGGGLPPHGEQVAAVRSSVTWLENEYAQLPANPKLKEAKRQEEGSDSRVGLRKTTAYLLGRFPWAGSASELNPGNASAATAELRLLDLGLGFATGYQRWERMSGLHWLFE
jgi:hypothetical protein